jgi:hypothetical protein
MNRQLVGGIPKTLTTLFLKDSTQFLILNGFSFVGGLLMFLEEIISTKDVHLLYYNTILSYPDISNLQRQQFEMNNHLSEVEMLNLVDIVHLQTRSRLI